MAPSLAMGGQFQPVFHKPCSLPALAAEFQPVVFPDPRFLVLAQDEAGQLMQASSVFLLDVGQVL
eukprot:9603035-Lingulodinium_polyedra.AAC.1